MPFEFVMDITSKQKMMNILFYVFIFYELANYFHSLITTNQLHK